MKEDRDRMCSGASRVRARGNGHKLKYKKKNLLSIKAPHIFLLGTDRLVVQEIVKAPCLEIIKTQLDNIMSNLF